MKTTVKDVIVEVTENGKNRRYPFPIRNKEGKLMTHRLKRLVSGKLTSRHSNGPDTELHFVGMVWSPPYTLLSELYEERCALSELLLSMRGQSEPDEDPPIVIPKKAAHDTITQMVQRELRLCDKKQRQIKEFLREPCQKAP